MLTLNFIRENKEKVIKGLEKRNFGAKAPIIVAQIGTLDQERKNTQTKHDACLAEIKVLSKEIGSLYQSGQAQEAQKSKAKVNDLKERAKTYTIAHNKIQSDLEALLLTIPNLPHPSVSFGKGEKENEIIIPWTQEVSPIKDGRPHWELAKKYNLIDFEAGVKISGAGFPLFRGKGARLVRALINFFLDEGAAAGYEEIVPPLLVNAASAKATGNLPDKEGQMYHCQKDDLYLIPTAEIPVTNIYRDVILDEKKDLPIKLTGYTPCFRREAGSYGAHVKGLNRVHQFDKVEIVQIVHPEGSYQVLDEMVAHVKGLLEKLELPFRILRLCGGDLGFASALTYDFEVYSAGQDRWLEVSSVSNFETYQTNRLKLRYRDSEGKKHLCHTLNGSALALARIVAALLENNQSAEGIWIPEVLVPYTGFDIIN